METTTAWKVSKYRVLSGPYFTVFGLNTERYLYLSVFSPNTGKYGPEITPYLDTFHAVYVLLRKNKYVQTKATKLRKHVQNQQLLAKQNSF